LHPFQAPFLIRDRRSLGAAIGVEHTPCSGDFTGTWRLSDGELRFTNIRSDERFEKVYWGVRPFRKLG
jgi:hypothetical protein